MAILTSYHKLVEREARNVNYYWKATTVIVLVLSIICCLGLSLCLQEVIVAFDHRCILGADLTFMELAREDIQTAAVRDNSSDFDISSVDIRSFSESQIFMANNQINSQYSHWGNKSSCDYGVYVPILQCCFGIIMVTMFLICGRGGKSEPHAFLPQPWRIVAPALIFFLIMTILSIINLTTIEGGFGKFCASFKFQMPDIECDQAMNEFMIADKNDFKITPGTFHKIVLSLDWTIFSLWFAGFVIMVARITFVIDFQLVRVTIKTKEPERVENEPSLKAMQLLQDGKDGEEISTTEC